MRKTRNKGEFNFFDGACPGLSLSILSQGLRPCDVNKKVLRTFGIQLNGKWGARKQLGVPPVK